MRTPYLRQRAIASIFSALCLMTTFAGVAPAKNDLIRSEADVALAPVNDQFAAAELLPGVNGSISGSNASASKESGEPIHARNRGGASVWYKYVALGNGVMTVDTSGSTFDTVLSAYKGTALNNLKPVAVNDDAGVSTRARISFGIQLNDVVYIAVDGSYDHANGVIASGTIQLVYSVANAPANDNFASARVLAANGEELTTTSNQGASTESGEPTIFGNPGGKSIWYKWTSPAVSGRSYTFTIDCRNLAGTAGVYSYFGLYSGNNFANLLIVSVGAYVNHFEITWLASSNTTYYFKLDGTDPGTGVVPVNYSLSLGITRDRQMADFDQDGKADISVFRPSTGTWYTIDSITDQLRTLQFETLGDKPALGKFRSPGSTDGNLDYAVFRPDTGAWYVLNSELGLESFFWGIGGDIALLDHSAMGTEAAVFRPSNGTWYEHLANLGDTYAWGSNGDIPLYANYYGSGSDSAIVFRPSTGSWYLRNNSGTPTIINWGLNGDKPVMADFDGDGRHDIAVFRPSNGNWYIRNSSTLTLSAVHWGQAGDIPQPADYDGDGRSDIAVFRNGTWYINQSSNNALRIVQFGSPGDIPVSSQVR